MAVTMHILADNRSVQNVECREHGCCAAAFVVMNFGDSAFNPNQRCSHSHGSPTRLSSPKFQRTQHLLLRRPAPKNNLQYAQLRRDMQRASPARKQEAFSGEVLIEIGPMVAIAAARDLPMRALL